MLFKVSGKMNQIRHPCTLDDLADALNGKRQELTRWQAFKRELGSNVSMELGCYGACTVGEFSGELIAAGLRAAEIVEVNPQISGTVLGLSSGLIYGAVHVYTAARNADKKIAGTDMLAAVVINESSCVVSGTAVEAGLGAYVNAAVVSLENAATHLVGVVLGFPMALGAMSLSTLYRRQSGPSYLLHEDDFPKLFDKIEESLDGNLDVVFENQPNSLLVMGSKYDLELSARRLTQTDIKNGYDSETHVRLVTHSPIFRYNPSVAHSFQHTVEAMMYEDGIPFSPVGQVGCPAHEHSQTII